MRFIAVGTDHALPALNLFGAVLYHELISFGKRKNGQTSEKLREKTGLTSRAEVSRIAA